MTERSPTGTTPTSGSTSLPPPRPVEPSAERLRHPLALFAVAVIVGLTAALAIGFPTGVLVAEASMNDCSPSDGWCGLGAALAGMFFGGLAGLAAYIGTGLAVVRRCRSAGRRAGHIAAHIVFPFLFVLLAGVASNL